MHAFLTVAIALALLVNVVVMEAYRRRVRRARLERLARVNARVLGTLGPLALVVMLAGCGAMYRGGVVGRNAAAPARPPSAHCTIVHDPVTTPGAIELARLHLQGASVYTTVPGCQEHLADQARELGADVVYVTKGEATWAGGDGPACDGIAYALPAETR